MIDLTTLSITFYVCERLQKIYLSFLTHFDLINSDELYDFILHKTRIILINVFVNNLNLSFNKIGTGIIEYYLSVQSINSQLQTINGVILDGIMSVKESDAARNQIKTINDRFYLYISKCQNDIQCSKAFSLVTGTDQDILTVTLRLQMLFLTNKTNPLCTSKLGLNGWQLFIQIGSQGIEEITVRPLTIILIARVYRCSSEDQRVLSRAIPVMISLVQQDSPGHLVDPPTAYPNDGAVLSITTIWSDFLGMTLNDSVKTNPDFYNDFCVNSGVSNEIYVATTGILALCNETKVSKYNYTLPSSFKDVIYPKNPRYWGKFQVNPRIFRSRKGGALLFNGDLDYNSPMTTAQQVQQFLDMQDIPTKLVAMKGLTHVTGIQSYTKHGGFQSATCTEQIIIQFLYQEELNLDLTNINYTCNSKENLIGIDWFYKDPIINATLHLVFGNSTYDYWGINTTIDAFQRNRSEADRINFKFLLSFLSIVFFYFMFSPE